MWYHKRNSGMKSSAKAGNDFWCPTCNRGKNVKGSIETLWKLNGGDFELVDEFCYLGNMLSCDAGMETAV